MWAPNIQLNISLYQPLADLFQVLTPVTIILLLSIM